MAELVYLYLKDKHIAKARQIFEQLVKGSQTHYVSNVVLALGAHYLGQKDRALNYFTEGLKKHDIFLVAVLNQPLVVPGVNAFLSDPSTKMILEQYFKKMKQTKGQQVSTL